MDRSEATSARASAPDYAALAQVLQGRVNNLTPVVDGWSVAMIIALALVAIATGMVVWKQKQLARAQDQLSDVNRNLLDASLKEKNVRISEATKKAADATERAANADLARVQLEARLAPRHITAEGQARFKTLLEAYAGQAIVVSTYNGTDESKAFAAQLISALNHAGLKATVGGDAQLFGNSTVEPISIGGTQAQAPFMNAIAEALIAAGLAERPVPATLAEPGKAAYPGVPAGALSVSVGPKSYP